MANRRANQANDGGETALPNPSSLTDCLLAGASPAFHERAGSGRHSRGVLPGEPTPRTDPPDHSVPLLSTTRSRDHSVDSNPQSTGFRVVSDPTRMDHSNRPEPHTDATGREDQGGPLAGTHSNRLGTARFRRPNPGRNRDRPRAVPHKRSRAGKRWPARFRAPSERETRRS